MIQGEKKNNKNFVKINNINNKNINNINDNRKGKNKYNGNIDTSKIGNKDNFKIRKILKIMRIKIK